MCLLFFFAGGLAPVRPLQRLVGDRWSVGLSACTVGVGLVGSAFAVNVWQFLVGSGAVVGVGCALGLIPPLCLGFQYFPTRKGLVGGIINGGMLLGTSVAALLATTWLRPWFDYGEQDAASGNSDADDDAWSQGVPDCHGAAIDDAGKVAAAICWRVPGAMLILGAAVTAFGLCGAALLPKNSSRSHFSKCSLHRSQRFGSSSGASRQNAPRSASTDLVGQPPQPLAMVTTNEASPSPSSALSRSPIRNHAAAENSTMCSHKNGADSYGPGGGGISAYAISQANTGFDEALSVAHFSVRTPSVQDEDRPWSEYDAISDRSSFPDGSIRDNEDKSSMRKGGSSGENESDGNNNNNQHLSPRPLHDTRQQDAQFMTSGHYGTGMQQQRPFQRLIVWLIVASFALSASPPLLLMFAWNPHALAGNEDDEGNDHDDLAMNSTSTSGQGARHNSREFTLASSAAIGQLILVVAFAFGGCVWGTAHDAITTTHRSSESSPSSGRSSNSNNNGSSSGTPKATEELSESEARVVLPAVVLSVCSLLCAGAYSTAKAGNNLASFFALHVASASCLGGAVSIWPAIVAERVNVDQWLSELSFLFAASTAVATVIVVAAAVIFRGAGLHLLSSLLEGQSPGGGAGVDDDQPTAPAVGLSTTEIQALLIVAVLAVAASVAVAAAIAAAAVAEALADEELEEDEINEGANAGYSPLSAPPEGPLSAHQRGATSSSPGGNQAPDVRRRPVPSAVLDRGHR